MEKYRAIVASLNEIKKQLETKIFKYEIIYPDKNICFCKKTVFSGIEIDPRGLPIYSIVFVYHMKKFLEEGFEPMILFADKHAIEVRRPFVVNANKQQIENVKLLWKKLFKTFNVNAQFFESTIVSKDRRYKTIYEIISNTKNKLKYLPKEIRKYYVDKGYVPECEWNYVNMEVSDVLYFTPGIFFSDLPERPLHIALHEKTLQSKRNLKNMGLPFSFLSPTIPPTTKNIPAPTFYWLGDFRDLYKGIISLFDDRKTIKQKVNRIFMDNMKEAIAYIWLFIINKVAEELGFPETFFEEIEDWTTGKVNMDEKNLKERTIKSLIEICEYFTEVLKLA